jgi:hypothetical protein
LAGVDTGKNKNQTAAERAVIAQKFSGHNCTKCGEPIQKKDLLIVKSLSLTKSKGNGINPYHRGCY